jgi:cytochrome c551/c552
MKNKINKLASLLALAFTVAFSLPASAETGLRAGQALFDANSCSSCHDSNATTIGPSLKDIAKRYKGKPVAAEIAQRIRAGSEGRWGGAPHPAYEGLDENDALLMAKWILGGAPR